MCRNPVALHHLIACLGLLSRNQATIPTTVPACMVLLPPLTSAGDLTHILSAALLLFWFSGDRVMLAHT